MINIFKTEQSVIRTIDAFEDGAWVQMVDPSVQELNKVSEAYDIEVSDLATALDEEESSRISLEDGYTLILVDIPSPEVRHEKKMYTTIPLGILIKQNAIITICKEDTPVLQYFIRNKVREFSTKKKMRFIYQLLLRSAALYQAYLRGIDKKRIEIEERIDGDTQDVDIIELHELESTLVYFATSLRSNSIVLERLRRYKRLEQYPEDMELLEDVMVEYQQAIEMTAIYRDIIDGTRELLSSVVDNRLNNVMKYLTSITIVMAIPTIISGIYGMNVSGIGMPAGIVTVWVWHYLRADTAYLCSSVVDFKKEENVMSQELEQETAKKKIQTVIFDLDGTLLNTIEDLTDSVNAVCTQYGYPVYPVETIKSYVGNGIRKLIERAIPQGAENPQYEGVYESFCAYYQKHCRVKTRPYDGILTMLDTLKAQGIAVGIVSNKNHNAVVELRDTFFKDVIPAAIGQSDITRKKPAPDTVYEAMKQLGAQKETTVYIGDSEVDKQTADNAGLPCILVSWGFRERMALEKLGAWGIADTPQQILEKIV